MLLKAELDIPGSVLLEQVIQHASPQIQPQYAPLINITAKATMLQTQQAITIFNAIT
jgi:hypothetical protein